MFRGPARNWPLAARLTATVTALLTFAVVLMTVVSVQQETAELREELTSQADLILSVLTETWLDPIIKLDVDYISDAMVGLENSDRVLNIHVYDAEGRLIADIADEPGGPPRDRSAFEADDAGLGLGCRERSRAGRRSADHGAPGGDRATGLRRDRDQLATAFLGQESAAAQRCGILVGLAVIGAGVMATVVLSRSVTGPLRDLTVAAEAVGSGRPDLEVPVCGGDEVGRLTTTFSEMTDRIRDTLAEVEHERERFASIAESLSAGLMMVDRDGTVSYVNESFRRMLQERSEQVVGRSATSVGARGRP